MNRDQFGAWLAELRIPEDWQADIERMQRGLAVANVQRPLVDEAHIRGQLERLQELYVMGDLPREEYVGRKRALEASLTNGREQPTYSEAVLVRAARLLKELGRPWEKATADERSEICPGYCWSG